MNLETPPVRRCRNLINGGCAITVNVLVFVEVVGLFLLALGFHVCRRGPLQVQDATDHKEVG